ncbi:MAG: hypothetical protein IJZ37_00395, partial [Clostridia bacterium]|nr:hypothetical protein [Clostridia bacterium]
MAESIDSDLPFLYTNLSTMQADTQFYILDDQENCVLVCKAPKSFSSIVFASSSCEGDSFTVYSGGTTVELSKDAVFFPEEAPTGGSKVQTSSGGNGGFGGVRPF